MGAPPRSFSYSAIMTVFMFQCVFLVLLRGLQEALFLH
ncbi:hypothetical protein BTN50_0406 [Candidatus Enterovibrio altilux]|uniref:Uncharacterized protein n=1 Tax=Candidatus Enterovibrio altilux TaxID=1927128 RepID=A0A291B7H7_9GAMM|nr:hypothetical protein BTN50_0406 [Candidatus Enterovibrio luxaltus]